MDEAKITDVSIISTIVKEALKNNNYSPKLLGYLTLISMGMVKIYGIDYLKEILETVSTPIYHFNYAENDLKNMNVKFSKKFLKENKCFVIFNVNNINDKVDVDYDFFVTENETPGSFMLEFLTRELNNMLINRNILFSKKRKRKVIKNCLLM